MDLLIIIAINLLCCGQQDCMSLASSRMARMALGNSLLKKVEAHNDGSMVLMMTKEKYSFQQSCQFQCNAIK